LRQGLASWRGLELTLSGPCMLGNLKSMLNQGWAVSITARLTAWVTTWVTAWVTA